MESQSAEKVRRVQERRRSGASGKHQNRGARRARTRSASRRRAITQEDRPMQMPVVDLSIPTPALVVTPAFVQRFDTEYRRMIHEQTKPLGRRDPLAAVRVYAVATVLADLLRASGVQGVPDGEPGGVLVALRDLLGMHDGQSFADEEG